MFSLPHLLLQFMLSFYMQHILNARTCLNGFSFQFFKSSPSEPSLFRNCLIWHKANHNVDMKQQNSALSTHDSVVFLIFISAGNCLNWERATHNSNKEHEGLLSALCNSNIYQYIYQYLPIYLPIFTAQTGRGQHITATRSTKDFPQRFATPPSRQGPDATAAEDKHQKEPIKKLLIS